ncbi:hypothetical protein FAI41_02150 [Acetobacteraceae bacterium]|nr:hypothetical protein FAI41_02150 [Acetobacteraceae bacterium]
MIEKLKLKAIHLCSGARFDQNGGMSALGIMPPSIVINQTPFMLPSLAIIGHVWNISNKIIQGKLFIRTPKKQQPSLGVPFRFNPTGKQGTIFIVNYPGVFFLEEEGIYEFEIEGENGSKKIIYSFEVLKHSQQQNVPFVPGLSPKEFKNFQEEMKALVEKYIKPENKK